MPRLRTHGHPGLRYITLLKFTAEQLGAIDIGRLGENACIVAGPGSGKTTVLVERYRQLIASGVQPAEILAITFTEKAAANMRSRLSREFADDPVMLGKLDRAYVSTIHGFCHRLLKENATAAGVDPEFEILDEQLAVLEQAKALRETLDAVLLEQPEAMHSLLAATRGVDLETYLPSIYDGMRSAGIRPEDLRAYPKPKAPSLEQILATTHRYINGFPASMSKAQNNAKAEAIEWRDALLHARSPQKMAELLSGKALNLQTTNSAKEEVKAMRPDAERLGAFYLDEAFLNEKDLVIEVLQRFDELYRLRKSRTRHARFQQPRILLRPSPPGKSRDQAPRQPTVPSRHDRRIPGHQQTTVGTRQFGLWARPLLRRGRSQPIHLQLSPRQPHRLSELPAVGVASTKGTTRNSSKIGAAASPYSLLPNSS